MPKRTKLNKCCDFSPAAHLGRRFFCMDASISLTAYLTEWLTTFKQDSVKNEKESLFFSEKALLAHLVNDDTGGRCALLSAIVGAFASGRLQSNRALCRCADAANGQMLDIF